jgi:hypothetical protein
MAQSGFTPISIYYSTTASAVPTAANLVPGELAINTNDGKLYYEDSSGVVQVLATKSTGSIGGSNTQVQFNNSGSLGGSSGLTWDGSFLTTSSIKNSALTSGRVTYAGASGLLSDSAGLTYDGTNLTTTGTATATRFIPSGSTVATNGMYLPAANTLGFSTNSTERMRIDTGNLLVGRTSGTGALIDAFNASSTSGVIRLRNDVNGAQVFANFDYGGTVIGSITGNNTITSYNVTSDQRLKTNIVNAPTGNIDDIKVRSFDWIADGSHQEYGMVAQELIEVAPYAVNKPENPDEMMAVDYSKLVPMMIKEIQDLKQRIATLENK